MFPIKRLRRQKFFSGGKSSSNESWEGNKQLLCLANTELKNEKSDFFLSMETKMQDSRMVRASIIFENVFENMLLYIDCAPCQRHIDGTNGDDHAFSD